MNNNRWRQVERLFHQALECPAEDRAAFLRQHCDEDTGLLREVEELLAADAGADQRFAALDHEAVGAEPQRSGNIDHYRIDSLIGSGGMGAVYRAFDQRLDRPVALKFLHRHRTADPRAKQRFLAEARAASQLDHANICSVYDIGESDAGELYIAMALCAGASLEQRLSKGTLAPDTALVIAIQLADALHQAHGRGVCHRDLKPGNLIVDDANHVKLVDFGIAKIAGESLSRTGEAMGTFAYMAPEQFSGSSSGPACDIWALGVMLYEMLFGRRPFGGDSAAALMHGICNQPLILPPGLPAPIGRLLQACLEKHPQHRRSDAGQLLRELRSLRQSLPADTRLPVAWESSAQAPHPASTAAERRQLTLLRYSLHHSDAEALALDRLATLQNRLQALTQRHYGHSATAGSDEGTVYFGYPQADEHAAQNAVRCGLAMIEMLQQAQSGPAPVPTIRIGVHTAAMVVQDAHRDGTTGAPIGEAPRTAESIRAQADDNSLLVGNTSRRLVAGYFVCTPIENGRCDDPAALPLWQVARGKDVRSRLESMDQERLTPLAGRVHELGLLGEAWHACLDGEARVFAVSGDPGVGKSRLIHELAQRALAQGPVHIAQCLCAPYQRNTELYPFVEYLRRELLQLPDDLDARSAGRKLHALLNDSGIDDPAARPLLADLLEIEPADQPRLDLAPEARRRESRRLLIRLLLAPLTRGPLLLLVEDLHWADPTSLELIDALVEQSADMGAALLMVCTFRPVFRADWVGRSQVNSLRLGRLAPAESQRMLNAVIGELTLPTQLGQQLLERAEGNPLFIEELGRSLLESRDSGTADSLVPLTLNDSLLARFNRLGAARGLAQVAAVAGRDFERSLLARIAGLADTDLDQQLLQLQRADLVQRRGGVDSDSYRFRHALIRDAAYASLLEKDRRDWHLRLAVALGSNDHEHRPQPELLAHHFGQGGEALQAAEYWLQAGSRALQRHAIAESVSHCRAGLEALRSLGDDGNPPLELKLQMTLGPALMAARGYADPQVDAAYSRARELCSALGDPPQLFPVLFGLWTFHCVRARHDDALRLADQLVGLGAGEADLGVEAHMVRGITHYFQGRFRAARTDLQQAWSLYDAAMASSHIPVYGQDPGMVILSYQSWNDWMLGDPDAADRASEAALAHSRRLHHPFSLAYALTFAAWHAMNRQRLDRAAELAGEAIEICREHELQVFLALALALDAMRRLMAGDPAGLQALQAAFAAYMATGAALFLPSWHTLAAQVWLSAGQIDAADEAIGSALSLIRESGENWCRAELERTRGLIARARGDTDTAGRLFGEALELARRQSAAPWQQMAQGSLRELQNL